MTGDKPDTRGINIVEINLGQALSGQALSGQALSRVVAFQGTAGSDRRA